MRIAIQCAQGTSFLAAAVILVTAVACGPYARDAEVISESSAGPAGIYKVTLKDINAFLEGAKGKAAVINLWATWCPPCVAEMPDLAAFYAQQDKEQMAFYSLSLDAVETLDSAVKPFVEGKKLPFPVHILAERDIEAVSTMLRTEISGALPTTIVYNKAGDVVKAWEGAITLDELNGLVKPLL